MVKRKTYVRCPLCNEWIVVRIDKNGKPYTYCNDCGVQMFIRKKEGIDRLKKMVKTEDKID
ncbi:hypothetical protein ES703_89068 [subsurface metagenome]